MTTAILDIQQINYGQLPSFGQVWVGLQGSDPLSSPVDVYTDFALTNLVATPLKLDFNGRPLDPDTGEVINLYVNFDYSIQWTDKNDAQLLPEYVDVGISSTAPPSSSNPVPSNVDIRTTPGAGSYIPPGNLTGAKVEIKGGGAAGGGSAAGESGGGGSEGATCIFYLLPPFSASYAYTIGAAGVGAAAADGGNGGDTTMNGAVATGGSGGKTEVTTSGQKVGAGGSVASPSGTFDEGKVGFPGGQIVNGGGAVGAQGGGPGGGSWPVHAPFGIGTGGEGGYNGFNGGVGFDGSDGGIIISEYF